MENETKVNVMESQQLTVGVGDQGHVIINLGGQRIGYLFFTPQQARDFAKALKRNADLSEGVTIVSVGE